VSEFSIEFDGVSKAYGQTPILKDFSLKIPAALTTALVGESGSGKSTLLNLANGLIAPDEGTVRIFGEAIGSQDLVALRRGMGYAVQGAGLFPHLTVVDNIGLVAKLADWPEADVTARIDVLFGMLNLDVELANRYPHSLSGGQQQRVSLCRAMMLNPPMLLLDEPFSALDPMTRTAIHREFAELQATESRSVLLVTHDIREAAKLAQYIVVLRDGIVVQQGDVASVTESPKDAYVELLLGALS